MPKPRKIDRPHRLEISLPASVYHGLQRELFSDIEGRVPHGAYSTVVQGLVVDWLKARGVAV